MLPSYANRVQSYVELSITIPGIFYGADLIYNYPGWKPQEKAAFLNWAQDFIESGLKWSRNNNFENWRLVALSTGAALVGDQEILDYAFDRWKSIIDSQVGGDGRMSKELNRTRSLFYSTYALKAMVQTAEVARHQGVDLYSYKTSKG